MLKISQDVNSEHVSLLDVEEYGEDGPGRKNRLGKRSVVRDVTCL